MTQDGGKTSYKITEIQEQDLENATFDSSMNFSYFYSNLI